MSSIYVQTWRDTYLSLLPYDYLYSMSIAAHERAFLKEMRSRQVISLVAESNGLLLGFITGGRERNGDCIYSGEIYTLYVKKSYQRRGIGARLVSVLAEEMSESGINSMLVQVLKQNPYRHFYKKINGILIKTQSISFAGKTLDAEYYGWIDSSLVNER